jgi:hypothetical protein
VLSPGQSDLVATQIASGISQNVGNYAGEFQDAFGTDGGLRGVDYAQLTDKLNTDMSKYFNDAGLNKGGAITQGQEKQAVAFAKAKLQQELEKVGIDYSKLPPALRAELDNSASLGVQGVVNHLNAAKGEVTAENVAQYLQALPQLAQQAGQEAGTTASLSGGAGGLTAAQTTLAQAAGGSGQKAARGQQGREGSTSSTSRSRKRSWRVQDATVQHVEAMAQLAQSLISPFDKDGQISAQLDTLQPGTRVTTDSDKRAGDQGEDQRPAQPGDPADPRRRELGDRVLRLTRGARSHRRSPRSTQAQNTLDTVTANGGTGQALTDAQKALTDAQVQLANAQLADANADARSVCAVRQPRAGAFRQGAGARRAGGCDERPGQEAPRCRRRPANSRIEARLSMDHDQHRLLPLVAGPARHRGQREAGPAGRPDLDLEPTRRCRTARRCCSCGARSRRTSSPWPRPGVR